MIDMQSAVQSAFFDALFASTGVTDLADVWQNAPEDADLVAKGLVIIGLVQLDASDTKDGGLQRATVPIFTYVRKPNATQLYALNTAVRNALEGQAVTAPGADLGRPMFVSADPELMDDGETYWDKLFFDVFVQEE
jgi:hypothetical protein